MIFYYTKDGEGVTPEIPDCAVHMVYEEEFNPRARYEQWKCIECGDWYDEEEIIWALADGTLSTDKGNPYCEVCVPPEEYDDD